MYDSDWGGDGEYFPSLYCEVYQNPINLLDTPCTAGARSTSFRPAVDLNQRSISYVAARHCQNCHISAATWA